MARVFLVCLFAVIYAVAAFGADPVKWEQAETEHFLFVFEPRDRGSVDELLTFCEPIYERITGFFNSYPKKVPVIVRGRIDAANGFTSFLPARIELYLTAPTDHFLGARTESWLKILLTHELTHFVHASMDKGFLFTLSRLFGSDLTAASLFFLPGWMIEGPSTNLETRFTEGGRGRNPLFEMSYKSRAEEGRLFNLEQSAYGSAFLPDRIYVAGYILVNYLETTYGADAFRRIMEEYLGFPFFGPWNAIQKVTGRSASRVFDDLKAHMTTTYAAFLSTSSGSRFTPREPGDWMHPQLTARGIYVYHRSPYGFPAIVRFDPVSGREHVLQAVRNDGFSFSATRDGRTIYFTSMRETWPDPSAPELVSDLYSLDVDTGHTRQITRGAHVWQPAVSPGGEALVAVQGSGPYSRLVSIDAGSGEIRVLFSRTGGNVYTPAFAPGGRKLAFTLNLRGYQDVLVADFGSLAADPALPVDSRVAVSDTNVGAAHPVIGPDPFGEYFPSFVDDDTLLFSSDRGGALALYRADLGTGDVARILEDAVAAISAIPNGGALLYSSYSADGWCLKETPLSRLAELPPDAGQIQAMDYPAEPSWTGNAIQPKPYSDWPAPLLWLPVPSLAQTSPDSPGVEVGLGAIVFGTSLLGNSSWTAQASWLPASQQPQAELSVSAVGGPFIVSAESQLTYGYADSYTEAIDNSAALSLPLLNEAAFDTQKSFALSLGIEHIARLESPAPFTFGQSVGSLAGDWQNGLFVTSGVSVQLRRNGGRIDFDAPFAIDASLQNSTRLPVLDYPAPESAFIFRLGLNVPSFIPHHVFGLVLKATDVLGGPFAAYTDSFAVPRGFPASMTRGVSGQALAGIDYRASIALLDQPLLFSLAATGAAVGMHAEGIARWDDMGLTFALDPNLFVGGDFTLHMAFNAVPFALTVGAAVRIDTSGAQTFNPGRDLGVYLSISQEGASAGRGNHVPLPVRSSR